MLKTLHIRNYALIDDLSIDLQPGLTVITGETGAGKSIIIGALSLLLGEKPDMDMIRTGAATAVVEGEFTNVRRSAAVCNELGIDLDGDTLILRRRIERNGRGTVHANDAAITVAGLQTIADLLVDLHGQHQHQYLLRPQVHLELLDAYAGLSRERLRFADLYSRHAAACAELARLESALADRRNRRELIEYQWQELNAADLRPGLVAELQAEKHLLESSSRRYELAARLAELLSEQEGSAIELLAAILRVLEDLLKLDPALSSHREALLNAQSAMNDLWRDALSYRDRIDFSPERLDELNTRLFAIERLERKHGVSAENLVELAATLRQELDSLETDESKLPELRAQAEELRRQLCVSAASLSKARQKAKAAMEKRLAAELAELGLADARFACQLAWSPDPDGIFAESGQRYRVTPDGLDTAEFLFSANPGEELRPLRKVASGGELSRIMLALKTILAQVDPVPTLVFDEIDSGIGGRVAETVGRRLAALSRTHQVICITHLPQLARHADDHLSVSKSTCSGRTTTTIRRLDEDERVTELARMAAGEEITSAGIAHARELLKSARRSSAGRPRR